MGYSIVRILLALASIVGAAQLSFDLQIAQHDIPVTGQTLAVLVSALLLPRWEALIAISTYLVLGAIGQPVFADGAAGMSHLTDKSAGYLWGFLLATFAVSTVRGYKSPMSLSTILQGNMIGTLIILFVGFVVLAFHIGAQSAFQYGIIPYWMGAVVKIILGTVIVYLIRKISR